MERRATGAGGMPVQRVEMATRDMDVIADLINRLYVEHQARFCCLTRPGLTQARGWRPRDCWRLPSSATKALITMPGSARPMISSRWSP